MGMEGRTDSAPLLLGEISGGYRICPYARGKRKERRIE